MHPYQELHRLTTTPNTDDIDVYSPLYLPVVRLLMGGVVPNQHGTKPGPRPSSRNSELPAKTVPSEPGPFSTPYGCFHKSGLPLGGVLVIRALLFGVHIRSPDFWKLPHGRGCLLGFSEVNSPCGTDTSVWVVVATNNSHSSYAFLEYHHGLKNKDGTLRIRKKRRQPCFFW